MKPVNRRQFLKYALSGAGCALVGSYPVFIERNLFRINRCTIPVNGLPSTCDGLTMAHPTDPHLGTLISTDFIQGVVERTSRLQTDMIVCTGDYVHARNTTEEIDRVWPILSQLDARHGVHAVLGNHDHRADSDRSRYCMERIGQGLRHCCRTIERGGQRILIGGAGDYWEGQ
jgi:hypothetical protein